MCYSGTPPGRHAAAPSSGTTSCNASPPRPAPTAGDCVLQRGAGDCVLQPGPGAAYRLSRVGWGNFTVTSPGKDRRKGCKGSGIIVIWDSLSAHSLSILGVPALC